MIVVDDAHVKSCVDSFFINFHILSCILNTEIYNSDKVDGK